MFGQKVVNMFQIVFPGNWIPSMSKKKCLVYPFFPMSRQQMVHCRARRGGDSLRHAGYGAHHYCIANLRGGGKADLSR